MVAELLLQGVLQLDILISAEFAVKKAIQLLNTLDLTICKMLLTNLAIGIVSNYIMIMILIVLILKSSLGAVHDGTGAAISCPASSNYIMNPVVGRYPDNGNLFYFSNCTINSFKATLLTSNKL
jgi:hypothetical protein